MQQSFDAGLEAVGRKDWAAAAQCFAEAARIAPDNVQIQFNLGNARLQAGDKTGARQAINRALTLDPNFPNLRFLAGNFLVEVSDFKTAIDHYIVAVQQNPLDPTLNTNMAAALEQLNLYEEAYELYDFAVALGGDRSALFSAMHHTASHACRFDLAARAKGQFLEHLARGGQNHAAPFQSLCMDLTRAQQLEAAKHYAKQLEAPKGL